MAISFNEPPASRYLRDNECRAVINALDTNGDGILQKSDLEITNKARFQRFDTNHNGQLECEEAKVALMNDELNIGLGKRDAELVLVKFDANQDGFLDPNEMTMNQSMVNLCDGNGTNKGSTETAEPALIVNGKWRQTGNDLRDGRVSVSELANVIASGQLRIGRQIGLPKYF